MSGFLDTNLLARYLLDDPPELAERAARIIDSAIDLYVTDVILAEAGYVLSSAYRLPREVVVDGLLAFLQKRNISVAGLDKGMVIQGLRLCRPSGRVSFADALIWAAVQSIGPRVVYPFDARFPTHGVEVRRSLPD